MGVDVGADVAGSLGMPVGVGVDEGVGGSVSLHPVSVGVAEGVDGVTGGTDPGVEDPKLGMLDGVGTVLVGRGLVGELPVTPPLRTISEAFAQNATNKLT